MKSKRIASTSPAAVVGARVTSSADRTNSASKYSTYAEFKLGRAKDGIDASRALSSDFTIHDDEGYALFPPTTINVMMISWHEGVARREGIGWIWLAQWMKAKPEMKTIVLE